jgi:hypothetical protein
MIRRFDLRTPGRERDEDELSETTADSTTDSTADSTAAGRATTPTD